MTTAALSFHALMAAAHRLEAAAFGLRAAANAIDPIHIPADVRAASVKCFLGMKEWALDEAEHHEKRISELGEGAGVESTQACAPVAVIEPGGRAA